MRYLTGLFLALLISAPLLAADLESDKGQLSYALGFQMGIDFKGRKVDVDLDTLVKGIADAMAKKDPAVSIENMTTQLKGMQERIKTEDMAKLKKLAEANKKRSEEFLKNNKKRKGVVELPSGVQYRQIDEGTGPRPKLSDTVTVHYRASRMGDLEFDNSYTRGAPVTFQVDSVIKGWQEVLPLMKKGARWQIWVPPELAYGVRGQSPVGPNEALIFEIELKGINEAPKKGK
ncbi:MAG: FKBP-type peptidyl-prolyl cis-trans isomerase [bacterium]